jgi:predicted PurR-regulated permease PerM
MPLDADRRRDLRELRGRPDPHLRRSPRARVPHSLEAAAAVSWRVLVCTAAVVLVAVVLARLRLVVLPIAVALLLATVLMAPAQALRRRRVPGAAAAATVILGALAALGGAAALIVVPVWNELAALDLNVRKGVDQIADWLVRGPLHLSERDVDRAVDRSFDELRAHADSLADGLVDGGLLALELLAGSVLALVLLFFVLKDGDRIWQAAIGLLPEHRRVDAQAIGVRTWAALGAYLGGVATVALVDAVLIALGLALIGVPLVLPLAVLTFLGGFIPIVGATAAGFAAAMVALVSDGFVGALLVVGVVVAVQQLEGHLLQPLIVGRRVRLHPLAVILAVAAGAVLWGIPGAFLAVPVTVVLVTAAAVLRSERSSETAAAALADSR